MSDPTRPPSLENRLRAILDAPDPNPEFVSRLEARLKSHRAPRRWLSGSANRWKLRPAWALAILLAAFLILILSIGPQRMAAAMRTIWGYLPGVGFIEQNTPLRILPAAVVRERDGTTLRVEQVVADSQRTVVVFSVEGLRPEHRIGAAQTPECTGAPYLEMTDGTRVDVTQGEGHGWPTGYQHKMIYPALAAGQNAFSLVIPCLDGLLPGAPAGGWEIPVELEPAPEDFELLPVIELPTPTPMPTPAAPFAEKSPSAPSSLTAGNGSNGIEFQVNRWTELDDGYLLQGSLDWSASRYLTVGFNPDQLEVFDARGRIIPVQPGESELLQGDPMIEKRLVWALRTAGKDFSPPLTIHMTVINVEEPGDVGFEVDLGSQPAPGAVWKLDQTLQVAGRGLTVRGVSLDANPYGRVGTFGLTFTLAADPRQILYAVITDPDNHDIFTGGSGGGGGGGGGGPAPEAEVTHTILYGAPPTGLHRFQIERIQYALEGSWTAVVNLPERAGTPAPTPAPACLTSEIIEQLRLDPGGSLPVEIAGTLLAEGPAPKGIHFPTLYLIVIGTPERLDIGPGGWADLAPDGQRVIYADDTGLQVVDRGRAAHLSWSQSSDYHPLWSPDGERIAFVRGVEGVYTARIDGSDLNRLPGSDASTFLGGWLPDGSGIIATHLGSEGSRVQTITLGGEIREHFLINHRKGGFILPAPDGSRLAFSEMLIGQTSYGVYTAALDGSSRRMIAALDGLGAAAAAWSPDGRWLLVSVVDAGQDSSLTAHFLVDPDTCAVLPLPQPADPIAAWR